MNTIHDRISPTAKLVAWLRANTDIPYCKEIAKLCNAEKVSRDMFGEELDYVVANRALPVEIRFKSLSNAILATSATQVIELASGVAPRGLIFREMPDMIFIETDLPEMMNEKIKLVRKIASFSSSHRMMPLNALEPQSLSKIASGLTGPIAVIHEGLMQYFSHAKKKQLARNILKLLKAKGGWWITTDVLIRSWFEKNLADPHMRRMLEAIAGATGITLSKNAFVTFDEAQAFFEKEGFVVKREKQIDLVGKLTTSVPADMLERVALQPLWTMTVA